MKTFFEKVIDSAIKSAKKAASLVDNGKQKYVALDIGPIGEMLEPMGTLSFDRAYEIFKRQMVQGEKSGAGDFFGRTGEKVWQRLSADHVDSDLKSFAASL